MTASTGTWRIASADAAQAPVAVIGAGVMGAGIAQVAAQAGHPVRLMDLREGAAAAAIAQIGKALDGLVAKGRLEQDARDAALARLSPAASTAELADAALVIEVIVEKLEPKQALLRELDALLPPDALSRPTPRRSASPRWPTAWRIRAGSSACTSSTRCR